MSIEDPISYADWYWKHSVDATLARSEHAEKTYAAVIRQILDGSGLSEFMPDVLRPLFDNLAAPESPDWDDIQRPVLALVSRATSLIAGEEIARPMSYALKSATPTLLIDADMAALLAQRKLMSDETYNLYASFAGYSEVEAGQFYHSRLPYPTISEIIGTARYLGTVENYKDYARQYFDIPDKI